MKLFNLGKFRKLIEQEHINDARLGTPAGSPEGIQRRMTVTANLTGGKGFRQFKRAPKAQGDGRTRGEKKRAAYAALLAGEKVRRNRMEFSV